MYGVVCNEVYTCWGKMPPWSLYQKHFFLPERHEHLLIETNIPWNHLLLSYFEGHFIPWFDPAVPNSMLITLHLDDASIYLHCRRADLEFGFPKFGSSLEYSEDLFTLLLPTVLRSKGLMEWFPHGLLCWSHVLVGLEGWVSSQWAPGCWEFGSFPRAVYLQAPLNLSDC